MTVPSISPDARLVPGRGRYLVALAVFVVAMIGMGAVIFWGLSGIGNGLTRIVVPGQQQMSLEPGNYTIFHELHSVVDGKIYDVPTVSGLLVRVTDANGKPLDLKPVSMSARYDVNGHVGVAAFNFVVAESGNYLLDARYKDGNGPETVLAVGSGFLGTLLGTVAGGLAFAFGGGGIALFIALRTFFRRRRAGHAF